MLGAWRQGLLTVTRPTYHGYTHCGLQPISPYISLHLPMATLTAACRMALMRDLPYWVSPTTWCAT